MKKRKNNLDERQEQLLLKIEHNGYWLAFWGLLIAQFVQLYLLDYDVKYVAGEWIVFMIIAIYLGIACVKNGIWDRHLKPNVTTNLLSSLIASVVMGVIVFVRTIRKYPDKVLGSVAAGVWVMGMIFVICFVVLMISTYIYKKEHDRLEEEPEDSED